MGSRDYSTYGGSKTYNVYCQRCGTKYKATECTFETDLMGKGIFVCKIRCFDGEHPQDFVTGVPDDMNVPYASPFDGSQGAEPDEPPFNPSDENII